MGQTLAFDLVPPVQWQAGTSGADKTPFYFDCARCGASEPPIAGMLGSGPTFQQVGILPSSKAPGFYNPAMFCAPCWETIKRGEAPELFRPASPAN
jgi:hypothetical protein